MREPVTLVIENDNVLEEEITMYEKTEPVEEGTLIDKVNKLVFYATYDELNDFRNRLIVILF